MIVPFVYLNKSQGGLTVHVPSGRLGVVIDRSDAHALAAQLHESERAGARIATPVRVIRDALDKALTGSTAPLNLSDEELLKARRARRDAYWAATLEEERAMNAANGMPGTPSNLAGVPRIQTDSLSKVSFLQVESNQYLSMVTTRELIDELKRRVYSDEL